MYFLTSNLSDNSMLYLRLKFSLHSQINIYILGGNVLIKIDLFLFCLFFIQWPLVGFLLPLATKGHGACMLTCPFMAASQ